MSIVIMSILGSILFFSCLGAILFFPNNTHHIRKNSDENEKLNNTYVPTVTPTYKATNDNKPVDNESNDSNETTSELSEEVVDSDLETTPSNESIDEVDVFSEPV